MFKNIIMKSYYKIAVFLLLTLMLVSCGKYYVMTTTINKDGSINRDVYTLGSKEFMDGDMSKNPFLFKLDSSWTITKYDSSFNYNFCGENKTLDVKVNRKFLSFEDYASKVEPEDNFRNLVLPHENISKKFRWFYTYYTFTGKYDKIKYEVPIPISEYFTEQESKLWFQGDFTAYKWMNGIELKNILDDIEQKFMNWYAKNMYEISFNIIKNFVEEPYLSKIYEAKDSIYENNINKEDIIGIDTESILKLFDKCYNTDYFTKLFETNKSKIEELSDKETKELDIFNYEIYYELVVPGQLLQTNTQLMNGDTLVWKINAMRFINDDYFITAEYKQVNIWAFVLASLLIIISIISFILLRKRQ